MCKSLFHLFVILTFSATPLYASPEVAQAETVQEASQAVEAFLSEIQADPRFQQITTQSKVIVGAGFTLAGAATSGITTGTLILGSFAIVALAGAGYVVYDIHKNNEEKKAKWRALNPREVLEALEDCRSGRRVCEYGPQRNGMFIPYIPRSAIFGTDKSSPLFLASNGSADEIRMKQYKMYLATAGSSEEQLTYEEWIARVSPETKTANQTQKQEEPDGVKTTAGVPTLLVTDYSGTLKDYWDHSSDGAFEKITELLNLHNLKGIIVNSENPPYELVPAVEDKIREKGIINFPFICMDKFRFDPAKIVRLAQSLGVQQIIYTDDQDTDLSFYSQRLEVAVEGTGISVLPLHVWWKRPILELVPPAIDVKSNAETKMEAQTQVEERQEVTEIKQPPTESEKKGFGSFLKKIFGPKK